ncbi:MAG: peroxiredoxin [Gammaproteobacteria bacterium]|jgi:thioredoxin-dependent peroxiredoxin|nr:peroxiredoxin [Gammaproteobacteria bacterium]MBT4463029.1 peroxiredoxin [Gammaproteobacteria bacterium]MBT4654562.1 peroxiredoxin [Gammaproteobacteria bacterium]MBT5116727.1 peroxiredoxin [Gammaproteobacteria bacterium]
MFKFLKRKSPALRIGDIAPDFKAETTSGTIKFHDWIGSGYAMLFSHPKDFTPVCSTELSRTAALKSEFDKRNTKVIGLSVDSVGDHALWESDIGDVAEHFKGAALNFPLIADNDKKVAELYEMIHPGELDNLTIRSVFIIGPDKKIKLIMTYPASTGRNFLEILRALDSIQLTAKHKVATPVDWKQGDDCIIIPGLSDDDAKGLFPDGWNTVKSYLRLVPDPSKK